MKTHTFSIGLSIGFFILLTGMIIGIQNSDDLTHIQMNNKPQPAAGDWITLNGNTEVDTFFAGNGTTGNSWATAYLFQNQEVNLTGYDYGLHILNSNRYIKILNCTFFGLLASGSQNAAIRALSSSYILIQNCTFYENAGAGVCLASTTNCFIENNSFIKNGYGIQTYGGCANSVFKRNTILNSTSYGIFLIGNSGTQFIDNLVTENFLRYCSYGIQLDIYCQRNTISYNIVGNSINTGISVNGNYGTNSILYNAIWGSYNDLLIGGTTNVQIIDGNAIGTQADTDADGLSDFNEITIWNTDRLLVDSDNDRLNDGFEISFGSNPLNASDPGYIIEFSIIWNAMNGHISAVYNYINDLKIDVKVSEIYAALNGNMSEINAVIDKLGITIGDTDYDGLNDLRELELGTNITCIDSDQDNLLDGYEVRIGTDPLKGDSDGDGVEDGAEILGKSDPLDPLSIPQINATTSTIPEDSFDQNIPGYSIEILILSIFICSGIIIRRKLGKLN